MIKALVVFVFVAGVAVLEGCFPFRGSPFSDVLMRPAHKMNTQHLPDLNAVEVDGVVRLAVFTDSHQNYRDTKDAITEMNATTGVDFVVNTGDFTNSAYNLEYDLWIDMWNEIHWPRVCVQGNHDSIGAGMSLYHQAFGPHNFYFDTANYRFIGFFSNNWESPDDFKPQWLLDRVQETSKAVIIASHVNLVNEERYAGWAQDILNQVLAQPNVILSLYGHNHVYSFSKPASVVMIQGARTEGKNWYTVEITPTTITATTNKGEAHSWPR